MNTQTYTQRAQARPRPRIAVVTMGVKLGDETRGYTRFRVLSEMLVEQGFDVDLITSSFQHWEKAQRDTSKTCYQGLPYNVVFIDEPGYTRNLDLQRRTCANASSAPRAATRSSTPRFRPTTWRAYARNTLPSTTSPMWPTSTTCGPRLCAWW